MGYYRSSKPREGPRRPQGEDLLAEPEAQGGHRIPGGQSRWSQGKDLSWEPLRLERVCEVTFEGMMNGRFRHNARFRRWRADKDPAEVIREPLPQ